MNSKSLEKEVKKNVAKNMDTTFATSCNSQYIKIIKKRENKKATTVPKVAWRYHLTH